MIDRESPQNEQPNDSHHPQENPQASTRPNEAPASPVPDETFTPQGHFAVEELLGRVYAKSKARPPSFGKRQEGEKKQNVGLAVGTAKAVGALSDIGIAATLRASGLRRSRLALPRNEPWNCDQSRDETNATPQIPQGKEVAQPSLVSKEDLRVKIRQAKAGTLILFVVDSSGSMGARKRMELVKGAILDLLGDAYRKRDRVGMIIFRGERATLLVPPTNSADVAMQKLRHLPTGGKTPLAAGLLLADQLLENQLRRASTIAPLLILVTDGRGNVGPAPMQAAQNLSTKGYPTIVLDSEQGYVKLGDAKELAQVLNGLYAPLDQLPQLVGTGSRQ